MLGGTAHPPAPNVVVLVHYSSPTLLMDTYVHGVISDGSNFACRGGDLCSAFVQVLKKGRFAPRVGFGRHETETFLH